MSSANQIRRWSAQYNSYTPSTDVPNLVNWWRADTVTVVSGAVSQLTDKQGTVNLTQSTATKRPTYNAADSLMGGRDSITSDGIQHSLTAASPGVGSMSEITIFVVVRSAVTPASSVYLLALGNASTPESVSIALQSGGQFDCRYLNPASTTSTWRLTGAQANVTANNPTILSFSGVLANGGSTIWEGRSRLGSQGSAVGNSATAGTLVNQAVGLFANAAGTSTYSACTLAELMICNAALTTEQMRSVEMYLAGYYGVLT